MNVIFHIDEVEKWQMVISNVKNFRKEVLKGKIVVLVNGEAVIALLENSSFSLSVLTNLPDVEVEVCQNSLHQYNIAKQQLQPTLEQVPSGVVELARKQSEGYAYIKP